MTYKIDIDPAAVDQIKALPAGTEQAMAEVLTVLELVPENGAPYNKAKSDGNMRDWCSARTVLARSRI